MNHKLTFQFDAMEHSKRILVKCATCHEQTEILGAPETFKHRNQIFVIPAAIRSQYLNYNYDKPSSSQKGAVRWLPNY